MGKTQDENKGKQYWGATAGSGNLYKAKTELRITYPEGCQDVRLLNLADITAPGGLTIRVKLPFPMTEPLLLKLADAVKMTGGTVEIKE